MNAAGPSTTFRSDARWWRPEFEKQRFEHLLSVVNRVWTQQNYRRELHLRHARLYGNLPILGLGPRAYARKALAGNSSKLAFNVVKSCVDAYTAKVTKERPKVTFVTSGGDWEIQERAKKLDRFVEGQFYETALYELAPSIVLDSSIYGNGLIHIFIDESSGSKRIGCERVFLWEILVDDEEGVYGSPRNFYRRKYIDRVVAEEMWPEYRDEIAIAKREENGVDEWGYDSTADQVLITEAWHLRSGPKAKDGRHVIAISNCTLLDEEYDKDYFPFIALRKQPCLIGWFGTGLAEELEGIQLELNVLLRKIQRSHHLLAAGHWLVRKGTVNKQKLDNDIGSIIEYTTDKPELAVGMTVSPDVYQHLDRLYQKAYEITGISQLQAQGLKPAGLDSGEAQRVYLDIQTERFQVSLRLYQHWFLEIARQMIDLAREISATTPSFAVKAVGRKTMDKVIFKEHFLDDEDYVLKLYPTNALAREPASRIAQVQTFANAGWVDPREAKRLLDFPDLEEANLYDEASFNLLMDIISDIRNEGRYSAPEPMMDLQEGIKWMQRAYLVGKRDRVPTDRLEMMLTWLEQATDMIKAATPPPPPPMPPMPPGPPGTNPGAPPAMGAPPPPVGPSGGPQGM